MATSTQTITPAEAVRRRLVVDESRHSTELEGGRSSDEARAIQDRWADGEISLEEYGAQVAALLGLPYAFASHFAPAMMLQALQIYRRQFRPSARWPKPYVMVGVNTVLADSDEEARRLFTSVQLRFHGIRHGARGALPRPIAQIEDALSPEAIAGLDTMLSVALVGSPTTAREQLAQLVAQTGADELMATAHIHDHHARLRSFEMLAGLV